MLKIVNNDIWRGMEKIGWLEGNDVYDSEGRKLGYFSDNDIYDADGRKIAYLKDDDVFSTGGKKLDVSEINREIQGSVASSLERAAVRMLLGN